MKKLYTSPKIEFKEFKLFEAIATSPIPSPPSSFNIDGLDSDINSAITSYNVNSAKGINSFIAGSPSPSPTPGV